MLFVKCIKKYFSSNKMFIFLLTEKLKLRVAKSYLFFFFFIAAFLLQCTRCFWCYQFWWLSHGGLSHIDCRKYAWIILGELLSK